MADEQLFNARKEIVKRVSNDIILQLLDGLLGEKVLNDGEKDAVIEGNNTTADKARCLIDKVRMKGPKASEKFFNCLKEVDPALYDQLNLPTYPLSGPTVKLSQPEASAGPTVKLSQPEVSAVSPELIPCTKEFKSDLLKKEANSSISDLKGLKLDFVKVEEIVTVTWKQGSILGFGGDRSQTYNRCKYALGGSFVQVYIDSAKPTPKQLKMDSRMRYGINDGTLFFVLDNHENQPFQQRFVQNATQKSLYAANEIIQDVRVSSISIPELPWLAGDYLRKIE